MAFPLFWRWMSCMIPTNSDLSHYTLMKTQPLLLSLVHSTDVLCRTQRQLPLCRRGLSLQSIGCPRVLVIHLVALAGYYLPIIIFECTMSEASRGEACLPNYQGHKGGLCSLLSLARLPAVSLRSVSL